ncbi:MAG: preprotein translocase subunit YajC [Desulfarculus sp.]|nr:preprotein translocase subunit YajC [Desulfarculus sp.]
MFDLFTATSAWAQEGGAAGGLGSLLSGPLPMLVLMFAVFYFLLIRPQQKKAKQHKEMLSNLRKGDNVLTSGGLYGKITGITDNVVVLEVAPQVRVKVSRGHIAGVAGGEAPAAPAPEKK